MKFYQVDGGLAEAIEAGGKKTRVKGEGLFYRRRGFAVVSPFYDVH